MIQNRSIGFYERYLKRMIDIFCALTAIIIFSWLYLIIAILVRINLGTPVIFKQPRPGLIDPKTGKERIFHIFKFRTMKDLSDEHGKPLPDNIRLTHFGRWLRSTSLDELPEAFNILLGDMSIIGPRPQLVRDMVFMTPKQRMRHTARPGLSGLAQVMGRNSIHWDEKLEWDLRYIQNITLMQDIAIILKTVKQVFLKNHDFRVTVEITDDYGDQLLKENRITREQYDNLQHLAAVILSQEGQSCRK